MIRLFKEKIFSFDNIDKNEKPKPVYINEKIIIKMPISYGTFIKNWFKILKIFYHYFFYSNKNCFVSVNGYSIIFILRDGLRPSLSKKLIQNIKDILSLLFLL